MNLRRRDWMRQVALGSVAAAVEIAPRPLSAADGSGGSRFKKRITGADLDTNHRWRVAGTDLGIPYVLENGSIGYLFGDTFASPAPEEALDWRSPIMLRSNVHPAAKTGIVFDSAARIAGNGRAPELMHNGHNGPGLDGIREVSVIPNDGISFPETKRQIISYMSIEHWRPAGPLGPQWKSNYAGLAVSDNGNDFTRAPVKFPNDPGNTDPFQMWTMQRDENFVYLYSVRAGRQDGPMMLRRVRVEKLLERAQYEDWGFADGKWGWGNPCTPMLTGRFGEPSVRRLRDGTWVMAYLNAATRCIVTRTATAPVGPWSEEKVQVTFRQEPSLYGGFIHPWSSTRSDDLHLMISRWTRGPAGKTTSYHVSQFVGSV